MPREQDVRAVIEGIAESFSKLDVIRWLSFFNPQHTFVLHDSVFVAQSLEDTRNAFSPMIDNLKAIGFRRSALDLCNIRFLGPKLAVASTVWRRLGEKRQATGEVWCDVHVVRNVGRLEGRDGYPARRRRDLS